MVTRGHFITIKISPGGGKGNRVGKCQGTGGSRAISTPCHPPLASPMERQFPKLAQKHK